jgi:hypothetical protein
MKKETNQTEILEEVAVNESVELAEGVKESRKAKIVSIAKKVGKAVAIATVGGVIGYFMGRNSVDIDVCDDSEAIEVENEVNQIEE